MSHTQWYGHRMLETSARGTDTSVKSIYPDVDGTGGCNPVYLYLLRCVIRFIHPIIDLYLMIINLNINIFTMYHFICLLVICGMSGCEEMRQTSSIPREFRIITA